MSEFAPDDVVAVWWSDMKCVRLDAWDSLSEHRKQLWRNEHFKHMAHARGDHSLCRAIQGAVIEWDHNGSPAGCRKAKP